MDGDARESWSYSGEVWTGDDGLAVVALPAFVAAHRAGFDYQLVPVAADCSVTVVEPILDARFTIQTDTPHVKVAWRVTALRDNPIRADR